LPDYTKYTSPELKEWITEVNTLLAEYNKDFTAVKIKSALAIAMRIAALGNKLLQSNTLDNKTFEAEPDKIAAVLGLAVNLLVLLVAIFRPFIPVTSTNIAAQLGMDKGESIDIPDTWTGDYVKPGHKLGEPARLFEPIKPEMEAVWRDQFGGEEVRKAKEEKAAKAEKKRLDKLKKKEKKAAAATTPAAAGGSPEAAGADSAAQGTAADDKEVQELAQKVEDLKN
jgi:methionyl-tRNA synthetase